MMPKAIQNSHWMVSKYLTGPKFPLNNITWWNGEPITEWICPEASSPRTNHVSYDPGMVVWFYDARWGEDNMTGLHPGEGFLGVVDAHQRGHYWNDGTVADTRYQINNAAFGFKKTSPIDIEFNGSYMKYDPLPGIPAFYDGHDYTSPFNPDGGKSCPITESESL